MLEQLTRVLEYYDIQSEYDGDRDEYTVALTDKNNLVCYKSRNCSLENAVANVLIKCGLFNRSQI
jgi:hypothetical protein